MPSALFLYSDATGQGQVNRNLEKILFRLRKRFEPLDVVKTQSMEEGMRRAVDSCGKYDVLIFSGGDGTFNHIASSLVGKENAPTLGYINGGTIGDIGQNFGIHRSYKSALKIIEQGHTCGFDMGQVNDMWFTYVAAVGAFADIPYVTPRKYKKRIGRIAYYFKAVGDAFRPKKIPVHVEADGKIYDVLTPFILCLSGKNVGGFPVNLSRSSTHDGKFELFLTKPGIFNGLLHYLLFKMRTLKIVASDFKIAVDYPLPWDVDGEKGPLGSVHIRAIDSGLRIFCSKKHAE